MMFSSQKDLSVASRKRSREAFEMRRNGATLKDIADHFSVSISRAGQLVKEGSRPTHWSEGLSIRARNILLNHNINTKEEALKFFAVKSYREMVSIRHLGRKTMIEICEWLGLETPEDRPVDQSTIKAAITLLEGLGYRVEAPQK